MKLAASKRQPGKANHLRQQGLLPAVVYNKETNITISVDKQAFDKAFRSRGQFGIIDLEIEGQTVESLVKQVQMNKRRREPQHVDFYAITRGQKVSVAVPVEYVGIAAGVRSGGQLDIKRREIKVSVLPRRIPEKIRVDITSLNIGEVIHIKDAESELPEGSSFVDNPELTLITVVPTRAALSAGTETEASTEEESEEADKTS